MNLILPSIESYGISDIGSRNNNEDVWAELSDDHFYVLADGMGGHLAGEIAAKEAVLHLCDSIERFFRDHPRPTIESTKKQLSQAFMNANTWIRSLSAKHPDLSGMGTTLCSILILEKEVIYAHVGDSRIYRFRDRLERLTTDHSLHQERLAQKEHSQKPSKLPQKNILTRAMGIAPQIQPDIGVTTFFPGDLYLLFTDGLHDPLSDKEIETLIRQSSSIQELGLTLVEAAKKAGGQDNITVLIVRNNEKDLPR